VERRPLSSSHIQQHKSGNPKAKGNGWGAKGGDSMVVDSVGRGGGRKGGGGEEKGRIGMGAATQTGASSWGVVGGGQQGGQGGGGAPQRRVLFHPAHNKGSLASSQQQHSGALLRPLNAPMAGCSNENNGGGNNNNGGGSNNSRAGPSGSPSSQHESLNWAPVSRIVSPLLASLVGLSFCAGETPIPKQSALHVGGSDLFDVVTGRSSWFLK
jgi:hypothetical protein